MKLQAFIDHIIASSLECAFKCHTEESDKKSYIGATQTFKTEVRFLIKETDIKMFLYTELFEGAIIRIQVINNEKSYGFYSNFKDAYTASENIAKLLVEIHLTK